MLDPDTSLKTALDALIRPASVAIAGASADSGKLGSLPLQFLKKFGYKGKIYPINPKFREVQGTSCYASMGEIDSTVDLLIVAVAAARIPALLDECRPGQVRSALVLSSGYAEIGEEGLRLQNELVRFASGKGIRFIGPNSVGVVNLWDDMIASISQVFDQKALEPGPVAFVSQSGAVGTAITALAHEQGIGIGYFLSTGNEADLEFSDFCEYFVEDSRVQVIAGYLESIRDGSKFQRVMRRANLAGKPIVLVKVGTTEVGARAVRSHTGALAGSGAVYRAVFKEHGVVLAQGIEELTDYLKMFLAFPRPRGKDVGMSERVAIVSHSGGTGVLMADSCTNLGLAVSPPSQALADALKLRLPSYASLQNPVDMTANVVFSPEVMSGAAYDVLHSGEYEAVMLCVNLIWRHGDALADRLLGAKGDLERILALAWIAGPAEPVRRLNRNGIPVFSDPVRCARAVAAKVHWDNAHARIINSRAAEIDQPTCRRGERFDTYDARKALMEQYRIPLAPARLVRDYAQARAAAQALGYPVVAKLIAPTLLHKTEVGGVVLGIGSEDGLKAAVRRLLAITLPDREGILIQKMVPGTETVELFAGARRDEVFGPVVVFGLGGIYVEVLREVVMRPAPFGPNAAMDMMREARVFPLLDGARGRKRCDLRALAELLSRVSILAAQETAVTAVDLNPIFASPEGAVVADYKLEAVAS